MQIELYPTMPTRPCRFCLSLQGDSVFADFDVDPDGCVFAVRVSFDGYGCHPLRSDVARMDSHDSAALLTMFHRGSIDAAAAAPALRRYFQKIRDDLWSDALVDHDLV